MDRGVKAVNEIQRDRLIRAQDKNTGSVFTAPCRPFAMFLGWLCGAFLFFAPAAVLAGSVTPAEIQREYGGAVVMITTFSAEANSVGLGSGFLVSPDGVIVTCYHVIKGAYPAVVRMPTGASFSDVWVLGYDSEKDIAVIKVRGRGLPCVKVDSAGDVTIGSRVTVIGNPKGLENTVSDGLLSGVRSLAGYRLYQISAPISPGSSGGPVFDESGNVIGVAAAAIENAQNLNFCVPVEYAKAFLHESTEVPLELASSRFGSAASRSNPGPRERDRKQFLAAFEAPLRLFWWNREQLRPDVLLRTKDWIEMHNVQSTAIEELEDFQRQISNLVSPDARLGSVMSLYYTLAQRLVDGCSLYIEGMKESNLDMTDAGCAKLKYADQQINSPENQGLLFEDLALMYLEYSNVSLSGVGTRLPAVFDSLPSVLGAAIEHLVDTDTGASKTAKSAVEAAKTSWLGYQPFYGFVGTIVDTVYPGTAAERAGLRTGDRILRVSDTIQIRSFWDMEMLKTVYRPGERFRMTVLRDGKSVTLVCAFDKR